MSKNPEAKKRRTCRKKKAYESFNTAEHASEFYLAEFRTATTIYECETCGKYHLTSRELRRYE